MRGSFLPADSGLAHDACLTSGRVGPVMSLNPVLIRLGLYCAIATDANYNGLTPGRF